MEIVFPGSIAACAWSNTLFTLIPNNHDDPEGIILSNFMLALVVLNSSIIKPLSFHLPFVCHPSFTAFVKLNRSWFSSGTIFTSQVSQAMDPPLCLQMTSNFPVWVQLMLFPFQSLLSLLWTPNHTPHFIACHMTGGSLLTYENVLSKV